MERFITQAADDPDVLTIKQTLYRTSGDSPIVQSLIRAAERGKQVVVLVEIKARFDEEANIIWARKLERAGAHVVYGLVGLKTHSKTALVVRREGSGLRRYVHIGTGNYNPKTARLYVDLGLLTARPEIGADVTDLFNVLTGLSRQRTFRRLLVAPHSLRSGFLALVDREVAHAAAGRPARIVLKLNSIVDTPVIEALYHASSAGVDIDLIVRAACSLQPGLPGISERIRVRSIIGEFLEHSRIWGFENGGDREWYIGSADLMDRNLDRRVEAVVPVEDTDAKARIAEIIEVMLADDRRSWQLQPDASWLRTEVVRGTQRHDRHVRGAQGTRPHVRARRGGPATAAFRGGFAGPASVTVEGTRPVEVELKYRVGELAAAERLLAAESRRAVRRGRRSRQVHPDGGPLRRHGGRGPGPGRLRRAASPVPRQDDRLGQVADADPMGPAVRSGARNSKARPTASGRPSIGRPPTHERWCSSMPGMRRWSSS